MSTDRPYAFGGREQSVISQLGEIVGQGIAAAERKRALTSDEVVELEFHAPDAITDALEVIGAGVADLADSLGIAPSTLSQHLRMAEKKIVESIFSSSTPDDSRGGVR